jgi:hypothetical protein
MLGGTGPDTSGLMGSRRYIPQPQCNMSVTTKPTPTRDGLARRCPPKPSGDALLKAITPNKELCLIAQARFDPNPHRSATEFASYSVTSGNGLPLRSFPIPAFARRKERSVNTTESSCRVSLS